MMILKGKTITVKVSKKTITITNDEPLISLEEVQEVLTGAGIIVLDKRRENAAELLPENFSWEDAAKLKNIKR